MSDLVGNPEDRFPRVAAQFSCVSFVSNSMCQLLCCECFKITSIHMAVLPDIMVLLHKTLTDIFIRKPCPCNVYRLEPHFYIAKLGYAGVYLFFLIFAPKHRLWVLVRTASAKRF